MNNINHIRKTFVRQLSQNDCGIACLSMILNYIGRNKDVSILREVIIPDENGLSLLNLKNLSDDLKLRSRCVQMDIPFLRKNLVPCILHMVNDYGEDHFQVCYGARKKRKGYEYLMADPARQVYYLREKELDQQWVSKAALFYNELPASQSHLKSPWHSLLSMNFFPKGLWISVPFLNICTAFFGIAISWVLQKGINDSMVGKKESLIVAILILLLVITLFRSVFSYIRQSILISINNTVNEQLVQNFIRNIVRASPNNNVIRDHKYIKMGMADIQKMQNAISVFMATILSDGSLILLVLSGIIYTLPIAGLINAVYLIITSLMAIRNIPGLSFDYTHLNELSGATEKYMVNEPELPIDVENINPIETKVLFHQYNHRRYLSFARSIAVRISKMNLLNECIGTLTVIVVFILGLIKLEQQSMEYSSFMVLVILSYFITALMPKISNALFVITEGTEAYLQNSARFPEQP